MANNNPTQLILKMSLMGRRILPLVKTKYKRKKPLAIITRYQTRSASLTVMSRPKTPVKPAKRMEACKRIKAYCISVFNNDKRAHHSELLDLSRMIQKY